MARLTNYSSRDIDWVEESGGVEDILGVGSIPFSTVNFYYFIHGLVLSVNVCLKVHAEMAAVDVAENVTAVDVTKERANKGWRTEGQGC